jgi:inorganic pyrophosphatase
VSVLAAVLAAAVVAAAAPADPPGPPGHPYHHEQHPGAPAEMWAVVEIPLGSSVKYEFDKGTGHLMVDRFQSMPIAAPANYGSFPRTLAADGDPLDAVVLSRHPVQAGAFLRVRPVGVIRTMDGEQKDDKVLVVPVSALDPTYDGVRDLNDVPRAERDRIAAYFRVYKQLPGGLEGRILETAGRAAAERTIRDAMDAYRKLPPRAP